MYDAIIDKYDYFIRAQIGSFSQVHTKLLVTVGNAYTCFSIGWYMALHAYVIIYIAMLVSS